MVRKYGVLLKNNTVESLNNYMKINELQENENTGLDFMD